MQKEMKMFNRINRIMTMLIAAVLMIACMPAFAASDDIASGNEDGYDWRITSGYELIIGKSGETQSIDQESYRTRPYPWDEYKESIKGAGFEGTVELVAPFVYSASYPGLFGGMRAVKNIDLSGLDTTKSQNFVFMFRDCSSLESVDLSPLNTVDVMDMREMFRGCSKLTEVDLSGINVSQNLNISCMFGDCDSLQMVKIGKWSQSHFSGWGGSYDCLAFNMFDNTYYWNGDLDPSCGCTRWYDADDDYNLMGHIFLENNSPYFFEGMDYHTLVRSRDVAEPVAFSTATKKIAVGKTAALTVTGPADIAFKSSKKTVATVTSDGKVTGVRPGTATITAYSKSDKTNKAACKVTVKYKLTYKMSGGTNSADNPVWYTGTVTLKDPKARKGYDFKGWYTDSKYKNRVKSVRNANKTLYAKWSHHSYYLLYDKNGGAGEFYSQLRAYGKEYTLPECRYTRKGYTFTGWNTKADGSGTAYEDRAAIKNLTSVDGKKITLYAQWKLRKYTIKYSGLPEGAVNENRTSYTIKTDTFSLKKASCTGYIFKGWFSDSKKTKPVTSVAKGSTGNKTIYSKWTAHKYTIRFDANGGAGTMDSMKSCAYGKKYALTKNAFTMPRYLFKEWNTNADGSGTAYADGAEISNLVTKDGGSITLYAQWEIAVDLTDPAIYMKQNYGSSNCTLYACAHMMRRKAILDGRTDWGVINSDAVEDEGSDLAKAVWVNGQGLKAEFSYEMAEGYILNGHCVEVGSMEKARLIQLLNDHPEGIECYDMYTANPNMAHGVLVTGYDSATGTFYCVDSDPAQPAGMIPLSECLIGDHHGNTQDNVLASIGKYWYLD